jgi:hypothetical protein
MQENLGQLLMLEHLLEDHTGVEGNLLVIVAGEGGEDDLRLGGQVLDGGPPSADLPPEEVVEYLDDVLARLELEAVDVGDDLMEEIGVVRFLRELGDDLGEGIWRDIVNIFRKINSFSEY